MKTISYLIDDPAVGGVTRTLDAQIARLDGAFQVKQTVVDAYHPMPPHLTEDAVVVHFTMSWSKLPFLMLLRAQRASRPLLLVEHMYTDGFERVCVPNVARFRMMLRLVYKLVDQVVCVSEGQANWMRSAGVVSPDKIKVLCSASDCSQLFEVPLPVRDPSQPLRLAAYGRYSWQKGYDVLIEAMRLVPPEIATLTFAGYGADEHAMKEAASTLPHVHVGPSITDLRGFLAACDAVVIPSRWEAYGLVATEARSAGRPIIVSDLDGLSEQVNRDSGIAVLPQNARLLADAIIRLHQSDVTAMGLAARQSATGHFERYVQGWNELLAALPTADRGREHDLAPALSR